MKILWSSNAPFCGTGYGVQTQMFGTRLQAAGHDVAYYATWGVHGACFDWNGSNIYPADGEWGNRTMAACAAHHADSLDECQVIALLDAWVLDPARFPDDLNLAIWAPVDHDPLPPPVAKVLAHKTVTPIAMSRYGERKMREAGLEPLYAPHGVETGLFRPRPGEQAGIRAELGLPEDAFVVGVVAANTASPQMHRKAFPQLFAAFARFRERHRDAVLYVHSSQMPAGGNGLNLPQVAHRCGIPRQALVFTDQFTWELGWSRETLALAYQAFDVLLAAAMGEGFGVPIVEAQASGVPVIVTDHSAMTELAGPGWLVDGEPYYNGPMDAWLTHPRIDGIVDALEQAYDDAGNRRQAAVEFAAGYDADRVFDRHWLPILDQLEQRQPMMMLARAAAR